MEINKKKLTERVSIPLTNDDLERYFGPTANMNIMKYSELADINAIEDVLPSNNSYKILLLETKLNSGHWIAIMRYNNTIEVFNSYGSKPSRHDFGYVPKLTNLLLGQTEPYLNKLLDRALENKTFKIIFNKRKFQKLKEGVNTCGRWCVLRIITMTEFHMTLANFILFMEQAVKQYNIPNDSVVSLLIP